MKKITQEDVDKAWEVRDKVWEDWETREKNWEAWDKTRKAYNKAWDKAIELERKFKAQEGLELKKKLKDTSSEKKGIEIMAENMQGGLWLTAMGRIVLDDHGYEAFSEPGDIKLFTAEQISKGIGIHEFNDKLIDALLKRRDAISKLDEVKE